MSANPPAKLLVEPLAAPFGAIVRGLIFTGTTSPDIVAEVEQAIGQHQVLVFRGHEPPSDAHLAEFTSHFGIRNVKLDNQIEFTRPGYPEIVVISNVIENGKPIGTVGDEPIFWHADLAWSEENVRFGFLDGVEVPKKGGETLFASGYAAFEGLSAEERQSAASIEIHHRRDGLNYPQPGEPAGPGEVIPIKRPAVVTNPATGRKALFMSQIRDGLKERTVDPSRTEEIERLMAHITSPSYVYEHRWQVGDLVMWDQIGTLHARHALPPERRILRQVTVKVPYSEDSMWVRLSPK